MEFKLVHLSNDRKKSLFSDIEEFKFRASDLCNFVRNTEWGVLEYFVDRSDVDKPLISGTLPSETLLNTFYMKYRHFYSNDSVTNYFSLVKALATGGSDPLLTLYHRNYLKPAFFRDFILKFAFIESATSFTPKEIIYNWFNAYYFHGQQPEREKVTILENMVSAEGARIALWHTVWASHFVIGELLENLKETSVKNPYMKVPTLCTI